MANRILNSVGYWELVEVFNFFDFHKFVANFVA
ncbi:MAG: hypothetical protein RIQ33_1245 [Bacteroidota bacterium]